MYFSVRGRAAEQGIIFRIPTQGQGIIFVNIGSTTGSIWGSIWSFLTPKRRFRPFALRDYDLNRLDGNISTFSDRFLTNFQSRARFRLKKLKDKVLFKLPFAPRQCIIFRNLTAGWGSISDFPGAPPHMLAIQVPPPPEVFIATEIEHKQRHIWTNTRNRGTRFKENKKP